MGCRTWRSYAGYNEEGLLIRLLLALFPNSSRPCNYYRWFGGVRAGGGGGYLVCTGSGVLLNLCISRSMHVIQPGGRLERGAGYRANSRLDQQAVEEEEEGREVWLST